MSDHIWFTERIAAALAGGLSAEEHAQFVTHRAECPACAAEFELAEQTEKTMTQLFASINPAADFENRLIARLRGRAPRLRINMPHIHPVVRRAAIAASAALVLGGLGYVGNQQMENGTLPFFESAQPAHYSSAVAPGKSFDENDKIVLPTDDARAPQSAPPTPASVTVAQKPPSAGMLKLDFKDVPVNDALDEIAKATGKSVVRMVQPRGRVTVQSNQPVSAEDAVALLNTSLNTLGYATIEQGNILKINEISKAKVTNIPVRVINELSDVPLTDELATYVIPLKYVDAQQVKNEVASLVNPGASFTANSNSNSIMIRDTSSNVHRVAEAARSLDQRGGDILGSGTLNYVVGGGLGSPNGRANPWDSNGTYEGFSGTLASSGGINANGGVATARGLDLNGYNHSAGTLSPPAFASSNNVSGAGSIYQHGASTNSPANAGLIKSSLAELRSNNNNILNSSTVTINGGTSAWGGTMAGSSNSNNVDTGRLQFSRTNTYTGVPPIAVNTLSSDGIDKFGLGIVSSTLSSNQGFAEAGAGAPILVGTNASLSGPLAISAGTVRGVVNKENLNTTSVAMTGGTLSVAGALPSNATAGGTQNLAANFAGLVVDGNGGASSSGPTHITKIGSGTLALGKTSAYTGVTINNGGVILNGSDAAGAQINVATQTAGRSLTLGGNFDYAGVRTATADPRLYSNGTISSGTLNLGNTPRPIAVAANAQRSPTGGTVSVVNGTLDLSGVGQSARQQQSGQRQSAGQQAGKVVTSAGNFPNQGASLTDANSATSGTLNNTGMVYLGDGNAAASLNDQERLRARRASEAGPVARVNAGAPVSGAGNFNLTNGNTSLQSSASDTVANKAITLQNITFTTGLADRQLDTFNAKGYSLTAGNAPVGGGTSHFVDIDGKTFDLGNSGGTLNSLATGSAQILGGTLKVPVLGDLSGTMTGSGTTVVAKAGNGEALNRSERVSFGDTSPGTLSASFFGRANSDPYFKPANDGSKRIISSDSLNISGAGNLNTTNVNGGSLLMGGTTVNYSNGTITGANSQAPKTLTLGGPGSFSGESVKVSDTSLSGDKSSANGNALGTGWLAITGDAARVNTNATNPQIALAQNAPGPQRQPAPQPVAQPAPNQAQAQPASIPAIQNKIIRNGEVEFEVDSFDSSAMTVMKIAAEDGGYVATTNSEKLPNGKVRGTMVLRVPPDHLDVLVLKLRALGDLKRQNLTASDVTKQYTDSASELRAGRAMEERLLAIIKDSKAEVKDLLAVEQELATWRAKIEKLEGELRYYDNLVAMSTLNISLTERDIKTPASATESETVDMGVEAEDVETARTNAIKAIDDAKGRIISSDLKKLDAGQFAAHIVADIAPENAGPALDRLRQIGKVARMDVSRAQKTNNGSPPLPGTKLDRGDTHVVISLYNLANVAPRRTTNLNISCDNVEQAYNAIISAVGDSDGRVVSSNLNRQTNEQTNGVIQFEVKAADAEKMLSSVRGVGEVGHLTVAENPDTNNVTNAKRGFYVSLNSFAVMLPREVNNRMIATNEVEKSYQTLLSAVRTAAARVLVAKLENTGMDGQRAGYLDFEIRRAGVEALEKAIAASGETVDRNVATSADADNITDSKVQYKMRIISVLTLAPRQINTVWVETPNVGDAAAAVQSAVSAQGGRIVDSNLARDNTGQRAHLVIDLPMSHAPAVMAKAHELGTIRSNQDSSNPQAASGESARARLDITFATAESLVTADNSPFNTVRKGFATSFTGLMWSLQLIVIGLCFVVPWVLLLWGGWRIYKRSRRAAPTQG